MYTNMHAMSGRGPAGQVRDPAWPVRPDLRPAFGNLPLKRKLEMSSVRNKRTQKHTTLNRFLKHKCLIIICIDRVTRSKDLAN